MNFDKKNLSDKTLLYLYKNLLKTRLFEERMLILLRQNKLSKWFSSIGQEAISVGATCAMENEAFLLPAHRNLGVFISRDIGFDTLFAQIQGQKEGFTKGRDRSFHFGSNDHKIIGMISHMAAQLPVACGIALAQKLSGDPQSTIAFLGEGATSEGDFHEALNLAAVWELPIIFIVENNAFALSTPISEQFKIHSFTEKGAAYGIEAFEIDGNNVIEVYNAIRRASSRCVRLNRPILIEAKTFRMRGHEESASNDFVPENLLKRWAKKDPLINFENYLLKEKILDPIAVVQLHDEIESEIKLATQKNYEALAIDSELEIEDVYRNYSQEQKIPDKGKVQKMRFVDSITHTLDLNLEKHPDLILMGQDIAEFGGVFKATQGLIEKFGKERIRNTPLCESAVIGAALGLSIMRRKSVVEIQFADFVSSGFNQVVNNLAKTHYRWGQNVDVVLRMPTGAGSGAGPFHSQSNEAWFFKTPGLKIVYPSSPSAAKGLLSAAIADPNPVLFFEHKKLYRSIEEDVILDDYQFEIGKAKTIKTGEQLSIITYGMGVHWAKEIVDARKWDIEIIDLQSLMPWDKNALQESIKKTGKVLFLTEDTQQGNILNDLAVWVTENLFEYLDAAPKVLGSLNTPIPFNKGLEDNFLAKSRLEQTIQSLLKF